MKTEEEVIYTLWDIVRSGSFNQDDPINERLMRQFLRQHRGKLLSTKFVEGEQLPEEVFQYLGELPMMYDPMKEEFVTQTLPKLILMKSYSGIKANVYGYPLSVVGSEEFSHSRMDRFNSKQPMAKLVNNRLVVRNGLTQEDMLSDFSGSSLNYAVNGLTQDAASGVSTVSVQAVLVNTDDEPGYDFTSSAYPLPDDLLEDLINSVKARDFNIFLRMKSDIVGNQQNETEQA